MVLVKCQWYDDEGNPLGVDGCHLEGAGCQFIHPSSHQWNSAIRRKLALPGRGRGRGRGRGGGAPSTRDNGWNGNRRSSSEWEVDGWKPKTPTTRPTDPTASPILFSKGHETSTSKVIGQWGTQSDSGSTGGSGWGNTTTGTTSTGNTGGWGSGTGWGETASAGETTTTGGGWGSGTGWGTTSTDGWGTTSAGGWGTTGTGGWGTVSAGGWGDSSNRGADTIAATDLVSDVAPVPPPTRPKNLQVDTDDRMAVDGPAPPQSASSYRAASQAPSERTVCPTPQSAFPPFAIPSSALVQNMTRSQMHSGIIKNSVRVTRIRLELQELKSQLSSWKTTQLSHQFHRVSPAAGDRLNDIGHNLRTRIAGVENRLVQAEEELLRFPDLSSSGPNLAAVDKEMMRYTEELRAWLQSFTALAVPAMKPPVTSLPSDTSAMDVDPDSKLGGPLSLFAQVEGRIAVLEEKLIEAEQTVQDSDVVSSEKNAACVDKVFSTARRIKQMNGDQSNGEPVEIGVQQSAAEALDKRLQLQADQVVLLMEKNDHELKQRIAVLEAQQDQRRRLKQAMQSQLEQFETWKQERRQKLTVMTEQLARLATQQPEATPVLDEAVLLRVRATVDAMIQTEVVPPLRALGVQYTEAIERRMTSVQQSVQPAVDQTNEICQRAELVHA